MKLTSLLHPEHFCPPEWDCDFHHIVTDSRDIKPGDLFISRLGDEAAGRRYIEQAIEQGAVAVIAEGAVSFRCHSSLSSDQGNSQAVPIFSLPDIAQQLPNWLQRCYPQINQLKIIGITGTNGKSSVSQYIAQLLTSQGVSCGVLGTLGNGVWPDLAETRNTTPDIAVVYRHLQAMAEAGINYVAMEVSSHGIDQGRIAGLSFCYAVVTNISRDHLDYHQTFDAYVACKKRLLVDYPVERILLNADDTTLQSWLSQLPPSIPVTTYGQAETADLNLGAATTIAQGLMAPLSGQVSGDLAIPLLGDFNIANVAAAISVTMGLGFDGAALMQAARSLTPANGRMELYCDQQGRQAVIDFAHTPDALNNVLAALQSHHSALALVFGCGGDRDRGKRPQMATAALKHADAIWLTDDNPRNEDPDQIFADVCQVDPQNRLSCIHDRRQAIAAALAATADSTLLVITGKGHEDYQEIAGIKIPYSDQDVLAEFGFRRAAQADHGGHI